MTKAGLHINAIGADGLRHDQLDINLQNLALFGDGLQAADAGPDEHTDFVPVDAVQVETRIAKCLDGSMDAELGKAVGAPDFLGRREGGKWVKTLDLGGNLAIELRGIEARDLRDAALASQEVLPESVHLMTQGGNHAQAGDDYSAVGPVAGHKIKRGSSS